MRAALITSVLVTATGCGALWIATDGGLALTTESARRLRVERTQPSVPNAALETMTGETETLRPDTGNLTLIEFIYTTCPTICQSAGAAFARLRDAAEAEGLAPRLRMLSLSFDPEADNLAQLAAYGARHKADGRVWTVARPDPDDLPELLATFGVTVIPDGWGGYTHNAGIHLVDDRGRLVAITDADDVGGALAVARSFLQ
ncbi:MAG: SCO family protein [Alphaproteobacteria bacterium]|nr:SCO family protein [Alphaproteobacteria bacterium]